MKKGANEMGRFTVEFEIANNEDLVNAKSGHLDPAKVRRMKIMGVIDSGAALLVLPQTAAKKLGLPIKEKKVKVRYADGRQTYRSEADEIRLFFLDRDGLFSAVVEPKRETALIGAIVLEQLDLLVDRKKARLLPRDPQYVISEIE